VISLSTTYEDFNAWLKNSLLNLTPLQKIHTVQRVYEKLRHIHNAIGAVYHHDLTVADFKVQYPIVYDKIKGELAPYVVDQYLSREGWELFIRDMFNPRHEVVLDFIRLIRVTLRGSVAQTEVEPFDDV
jgi:hypothetical protein